MVCSTNHLSHLTTTNPLTPRFSPPQYDENGDGFISFDEMCMYLNSVFSVIAETSPDVFSEHSVSPPTLARITARRCFDESDINQDGRLSFSEFRRWYSRGTHQQLQAAHQASLAALPHLEELRRRTGLGELDPEEVLETILNSVGEEDDLDRATFIQYVCCTVAVMCPTHSGHTPVLTKCGRWATLDDCVFAELWPALWTAPPPRQSTRTRWRASWSASLTSLTPTPTALLTSESCLQASASCARATAMPRYITGRSC